MASIVTLGRQWRRLVLLLTAPARPKRMLKTTTMMMLQVVLVLVLQRMLKKTTMTLLQVVLVHQRTSTMTTMRQAPV